MSFETYLGTSLYNRPTRPAWNAVSIQSRFLRPLSNMLATAVSPAGPAPMMAAECMCARGDREDSSEEALVKPLPGIMYGLNFKYVRIIAGLRKKVIFGSDGACSRPDGNFDVFIRYVVLCCGFVVVINIT